MAQDDPYDLNKLRVDPATLQNKPAKAKRWRRYFAMMPVEWMRRLIGAKHRGTFLLAYLLIYEHWRCGGRPIAVSNAFAAELEVGPRAKSRALRELERLGLIKVERLHRRSPRVTVLRAGRSPSPADIAASGEPYN
jgi:hypothetical protein